MQRWMHFLSLGVTHVEERTEGGCRITPCQRILHQLFTFKSAKRPGFLSCQSPPASIIWGKRLNLPRYQFPDLSSEAVKKDDLERVHLSGSRRGSTAGCTGGAKVTSRLPGGHR